MLNFIGSLIGTFYEIIMYYIKIVGVINPISFTTQVLWGGQVVTQPDNNIDAGTSI